FGGHGSAESSGTWSSREMASHEMAWSDLLEPRLLCRASTAGYRAACAEAAAGRWIQGRWSVARYHAPGPTPFDAGNGREQRSRVRVGCMPKYRVYRTDFA